MTFSLRAGAGVVAASAAVLLVAGCGVDPLAYRQEPKVGTSDTWVLEVEKDLHTDAGDVLSDAVVLPERSVFEVSPPAGLPSGGEIVFLFGTGFKKSVQVYFGDAVAPDVFYVNSKKLQVTTPSHGLGTVDVSVRWSDGEVETLPSGFLYKTNLEVDSVTPAEGPVAGGSPLTVSGEGFTAGTKLVIGKRLAIGIEVVDAQTLYAVSPPGSEGGPADVVVVNETGSVLKKDAFVYTVAPEIASIRPAAGPAAGGQEVEVEGKWLATVTSVLFGDAEADIVEAGNGKLVVLTPPGAAGHADVVVLGTWGYDVSPDGYYFLEEMPGSPDVVVVPDSGPEGGGNAVSLVQCDAAAAGGVEVRFGETAAEVQLVSAGECLVVVTAPGGSGVVDVEVSWDGGKAVAQGGYGYDKEVTVTSVTPSSGGFEGGTAITVTGTRFEPGMQVMVGPLWCSSVTWVSDTEVRAVTPPGSPGLADVQVVGGAGIGGKKKKAFLYTVDTPEIYTISPNYGSQAGGTYVEVIGAGFTPGATLLIGSGMVYGATVAGYGLITGRTPPGEIGTYKVAVTLSTSHAELDGAYTYFDPVSYYGGTWGAAVDGAVNVTVLNAYTWDPEPEAFAVLGSDPGTPYQGFTDENGQVTLSGPGLEGPVDLHVTKKSCDAASIVHFDAENATVYLIPYEPPTPGDPGPPPPQMLPGSVGGSVVGMGKYVVVPPGDCLKKKPQASGLCKPCVQDSECGEGRCLPIGKSGSFCTMLCEQSGTSCPEGYLCAPVGTEGYHCAPSAGRKAARCELSSSSLYQDLYHMQNVQEVDEADQFQFDETRLGELAIVCLGGFVDEEGGEFEALVMGVKRHVNVGSDEHLVDQNVLLNIPLSRTVRLRMDEPPSFGPVGGRYIVSLYLDFGSDGYFLMPGSYDGVAAEDVMLHGLPESLTGDIYDATYVVVGGAYTNTDDMSPLSEVMLWDVVELGGTAMAQLDGAAFVADPKAPGKALYASWNGDTGTYLGGEDGAMYLLTDAGLFPLASAVQEDVRGMWGFPGGPVFAVGEAGIVLEQNGSGFKLAGRVTDRELRSVWGSDPGDLVAVGEHRIVAFSGGAWSEMQVAFDLYGVGGTGPDDVWAAGEGGALLYYDGNTWSTPESPTQANLYAVRALADGTLVLAGDGVAYVRTGGGEWEDLGLEPGFVASGVSPSVDGGFYLTGSSGQVAYHAADVGFTYVAAPADLKPTVVVETAGGAVFAAGVPALLLTPFVPFQEFASPVDGGGMVPLLLSWGYADETKPISLHTIAIRSQYGESLWRLTVDGPVRSIALADFQKMVGFAPLSSGPRRVSIYSAYSPGFSINSYDLSEMGESSWRSWAWDIIDFQ
jgi:hypothetical protein